MVGIAKSRKGVRYVVVGRENRQNAKRVVYAGQMETFKMLETPERAIGDAVDLSEHAIVGLRVTKPQ